MSRSDWISIAGTIISLVSLVIALLAAAKVKQAMNRMRDFKNLESRLALLTSWTQFGNEVIAKFRDNFGKSVPLETRQALVKSADAYYDLVFQNTSQLKFSAEIVSLLSQLKNHNGRISNGNQPDIGKVKGKISEINKCIANEIEEIRRQRDLLLN